MIVTDIISQKEHVDNILYKMIPKIESDTDRREILSIKRNIFNYLSTFSVDLIERNLSNESELNSIRKHNRDRKNISHFVKSSKGKYMLIKKMLRKKLAFCLRIIGLNQLYC
jgi:hypothetical protein